MRYPPRKSGGWIVEGVEVPRPVFGCDIDGTLGKYHEHFLRFAEDWFGPAADQHWVLDYPDHPYDGSVPLYRWMGVSKTRYRQCKMAFRRGGLKRSMPVIPGASSMMYAIRKAGAEVVITTTRPFLQLENIDPDTQEWLRRNKIAHDNIIHGEHKYRDLARRYGNRVVAILEDLPEMCEQASAAGLRPLLADAPHNKGCLHFPRMHSLRDAEAVVLQRIEEYEKEVGLK